MLAALRAVCRAHQARVICIGDVHGCVQELGDLLRAVRYMPGDLVMFLGELLLACVFACIIYVLMCII